MENNNGLASRLASERINRRDFIRRSAAATLAVSALPALTTRRAFAAAKEVNFATYGGMINENTRKVFAEPFEKETGIKVNLGVNSSLALAKLQVASGGSAQWDIVNLTGAEYEVAVKENLLAPYDYKIVDPTHIAPEYRKPYGVKYSLFLFVMAWDRRKIPDDKAPRSWAEFWDTKRYPGKRSIYANVSDGDVLEIALLADGVPVDKLYPLDVERALKSLDRLGKRNIIWHTTNQEPIQQLISGEVALATAFNGRIVVADRGGAQIGYTPDYAGVSGNYLTVVRTSEHKHEAFEFLNYVLTNTKADVEYIKLTNYAMPNTQCLQYLPKSLVDTLPTSPTLKDKVFLKNDAWWAANLEKTTVRFKEWQMTP
ncbi:MAG TPA: extracellular solute-binding protein [Alphaproteobacteria bacterium]|nr:extracellular solute-binding protein [Alphaproteobacteria bacterium]